MTDKEKIRALRVALSRARLWLPRPEAEAAAKTLTETKRG